MTKTIRSATLLLMLAVFAGAIGLEPAGAQTKTKDSKVQSRGKDKVTAISATFELYKDRAGEFRFRLKDGDGALLAISGKGYDNKSECQRVIDTIKQLAGRARVEEQQAK